MKFRGQIPKNLLPHSSSDGDLENRRSKIDGCRVERESDFVSKIGHTDVEGDFLPHDEDESGDESSLRSVSSFCSTEECDRMNDREGFVGLEEVRLFTAPGNPKDLALESQAGNNLEIYPSGSSLHRLRWRRMRVG
ncbi:hypothetical protein L484_026833 [Morus notabilis]|uniref:Uncharacterized protein n=1 Tax=Morus notabilis TaxID=981085 RepID=W9RE42_9ROSA|nr:hypothetical protein L484_026833 [Morus notabilis]